VLDAKQVNYQDNKQRDSAYNCTKYGCGIHFRGFLSGVVLEPCFVEYLRIFDVRLVANSRHASLLSVGCKLIKSLSQVLNPIVDRLLASPFIAASRAFPLGLEFTVRKYTQGHWCITPKAIKAP